MWSHSCSSRRSCSQSNRERIQKGETARASKWRASRSRSASRSPGAEASGRLSPNSPPPRLTLLGFLVRLMLAKGSVVSRFESHVSRIWHDVQWEKCLSLSRCGTFSSVYSEELGRKPAVDLFYSFALERRRRKGALFSLPFVSGELCGISWPRLREGASASQTCVLPSVRQIIVGGILGDYNTAKSWNPA